MAKRGKYHGNHGSLGAETRKCSILLSSRLDELLSCEATRRRCTRSQVVEAALGVLFRGVRVYRPGDSTAAEEAA